MKKLAFLPLLFLVLLPALASAETAAPSPAVFALAEAMDIDAESVVLGSTVGELAAYTVAKAPLGGEQPANVDAAVLSTGNASNILNPNSESDLSGVLEGPNNSLDGDIVQLRLGVLAPAGINCAALDLAFYTEEYDDFANTPFLDGFTAEFGSTNVSIVDGTIQADTNFAVVEGGRLVTSDLVGSTQWGYSGANGTTYDGATIKLTATAPAKPDSVNLFAFTIQDLGDPIYDSAVVLDNFRWLNSADCDAEIITKPLVPTAVNLNTQQTSHSQQPLLLLLTLLLAATAFVTVRLRRRQ